MLALATNVGSVTSESIASHDGEDPQEPGDVEGQHPTPYVDTQLSRRIKRNENVCMRRDSGKKPRKQKYKVDALGTIKLRLPREKGREELRIQPTHECEKKEYVLAKFQLKFDSRFKKLKKEEEVKTLKFSGRVTNENLG